MNHRYAVVAMTTMVLGAGVIDRGFAQGFGAQPPAQGTQAGSIYGGPMSVRVPGIIDPMQANPMGLLRRPEVQSELRLDLRQKNALAALEDKARSDGQQADLQRRQAQDPQQLRNLTPEQRLARFREMNAQTQAASQPPHGELTPQVKEILKPEQVTRLTQLDRQRRGPLSLADSKLSADVPLSPEHRREVQQILQGYQQQQNDIVRDAFESMRQTARQGQPPPRLPDFSSPLSPLRQKLAKIRKEAEQKAMDTLSPEEKASWQNAQGEPFTFRADRLDTPAQLRN